MKYILAFHYQEYLDKCGQLGINPRKDAVYISTAEKLMGREFSPADVIITEMASRRHDYKHVVECIKMRCRLP